MLVKETGGMTDRDLLEAVGTLGINYRARVNGQPADAVSANPLAAAVCSGFEEKFEAFRKRVGEETGEEFHISSDQALKLILFLEQGVSGSLSTWP